MAQLDLKGFNLDTRPNLYTNPPFGTEYKQAQRTIFAPNKVIEPARDARYPSYAAPMADGRIVTDYRPQCSKNIAPSYQFNTKKWMVNHAEQIIGESRKRQAEWSGATLPMANTVPPAADIVYSSQFNSEVVATKRVGGIGIERANASAPELFGTYEVEPTIAELQSNRKYIEQTIHYEGGRNTPRGMFN